MGLIRFQPSQGSEPPDILHYAPESSATIAIGEPLQRNSSDPELVEAHAGGATVTGILGTALNEVTAGAVPFGSTVQVAIANRKTLWLGQIYDVSESEVATAAVATHEGNEYGMIEPTAGEWYVDEEDTSNVVLRVVKVLLQRNAVLFRWIGSAIEGA